MNHTSAVGRPIHEQPQHTPYRRQSWLALLGACVCGGLIALTWAQHFNAAPQSGEELSVSYLWIILVTTVLGIPGSTLILYAVASAHWAHGIDGRKYQTRAVYLLACLIVVTSLLGLGLGYRTMHGEQARVSLRPCFSSPERPGIHCPKLSEANDPALTSWHPATSPILDRDLLLRKED